MEIIIKKEFDKLMQFGLWSLFELVYIITLPFWIWFDNQIIIRIER